MTRNLVTWLGAALLLGAVACDSGGGSDEQDADATVVPDTPDTTGAEVSPDTVTPDADVTAPDADAVTPDADVTAPDADAVTPDSDVTAPDADALRRSGRYPVLKPGELIERARELPAAGTVMLHPLMGGMDPELGWESLRLVESKVLPALT